MEFLSHHYTYPMRSTNKEPQWNSVYDDLFNQYIDTDRFEYGTRNTAASSSDETSNNIIGSIEALTDSGESSAPEARTSDDFWAKTLKGLEESAVSLEQSEQREGKPHISYIKEQNPHSDFLSLGGYPSPHIGSSPTSPSEAARRRKASNYQTEYSGRRAEKLVGINKAYRSGSKSPKMMTPSRYRAGFKDTWGERISNASNMVTMNLPIRSLPLSPPPSAKVKREFCSPSEIDAVPFQPFAQVEEQFSIYASAFPQTVLIPLRTPNSSPLTTPGVERSTSSADAGYDIQHSGDMSYGPAVHLQEASWNGVDVDDSYESSPIFSPWMAGEQRYRAGPDVAAFQPMSNLQHLHDDRVEELGSSGLMISYDPTLAPAQAPEKVCDMEAAVMPRPDYYTAGETCSPERKSRSPSPSAQHRHRRTSSKGGRTPSLQGKRSGSFVNYTASDSAKLLKGVAPSGSSKTKARREKEAADKRRRFSQAAVKAVEEAGGNVTMLRDAGIMM